MTKIEMIERIAREDEGSELILRLESAFRGESHNMKDERFYTLSEIAEVLNLHVTWLQKLRVHEVCGRKLAGRRRYEKSAVVAYLKSEKCQERIQEINNAKKGI